MAVIKQGSVTTRKPHLCQGCGTRYEAGTAMETTLDVDDGRIFTCYWCNTCVAFIDQLPAADRTEGYDYDIWEWDEYKPFRDSIRLNND